MILVTGGTGMLGAHLLFHLMQSGEKVRATYRSKHSLKNVKKVFDYYTEDVNALYSKIDWVLADITDVPALELAFKGIEKVYHIAALVSFDEADYKKMQAINIGGTANIVNLSIAYSVKKLCFVSSIASISKSTGKAFIDETDEFNLETNNYGYALTKHGAEMEVWRGAQEGLDVIVLNPGIILGSGFWHENSGALFSSIYKGSPFYTEGITGFVGIDDVVRVLMKGMNSDIKNERFILVSENLSFKNVLFLIADFFEKKRPKIKVNRFIAEIGWVAFWVKAKLTGKKSAFTKHTAKTINNHSYYANEKVKNTFDFEFEKIQSSVKRICNDYIFEG